MPDCVLYFDIGNTNCKVGVSVDDARPEAYLLPTDGNQTADQFGMQLLHVLRHMRVDDTAVTACVGSSVVPGMTVVARRACERYLRRPLLLAPEDLPIPLENRYARPHEVGSDRLVGAFAARRLFPDSPAVISVDFGTATTFDCVQDNAYLGGLICPGVLSSAGALAARTAKLPQVSLEVEEQSPSPGRSTATSLSHGFVFGFAAMAEGLCARLAGSLRGPVSVVGTGGFARNLARVTSCFDAVCSDLLLDGLRMLYREYITDKERI